MLLDEATAVPENSQPLITASALLRVKPVELERMLRFEQAVSQLGPLDGAIAMRDALCRGLYRAALEWVIVQINKSTSPASTRSSSGARRLL